MDGWMEPTPRDPPGAGRGCSVLTAYLPAHLWAPEGAAGSLQGFIPPLRGCPCPCHHYQPGHSHTGIMAKHQGRGLRDREGPSPGGAVSSWLCFIE